MIRSSFRRYRKPLLSLAVAAMAIPSVFAQENRAPTPDTETLLREALVITVDMLVNSADGEEELWHEKVSKITIPGRGVTVGIEGSDSRLSVSLTPYPANNGGLLLVARNETWVAGKYSNGLTTIPIAYRDKVYYYPLGRAGDGNDGNPVEVRMVINIIPYLDTLDDEARASLESAFDATTEFHLTDEGD